MGILSHCFSQITQRKKPKAITRNSHVLTLVSCFKSISGRKEHSVLEFRAQVHKPLGAQTLQQGIAVSLIDDALQVI